ncbi:MAG: alkaline phosphatase D family protein [Dongiaceae bacterium]
MSKPTVSRWITRRSFLWGTAAAGGSLVLAPRVRRALAEAPAVTVSEKARPAITHGVMSGDVTADRAMIWSRADRPARMLVEWSTEENLSRAVRVAGPNVLADGDFTGKLDLAGLPAGTTVFYRVTFEDLANPGATSAPATGRLRTAPAGARDIRFVFSGDEAGQGWGINPGWGGYRLYEAMRAVAPDFFIHSGDQIYADGPLREEVRLDDGTVWKNLVTPAKAKVAETLDEFRGNFAYNQLDANRRRFAAEVPFLVQWDDHEVHNNWYPGEDLSGDARYKQVPGASLLAAAARRAMFDYNPIRATPDEAERVYRRFGFGPLLEVFLLDERSYRGPNSENRQATPSPEDAFLGPRQLAWLKAALLASRATWKVIASDMPVGLVVADAQPWIPKGRFEAWANAEDGVPLGRELELASLFGFIKNCGIRNVVWVTADVHYAQAIRYEPARAAWGEFLPFWEFVAGPINAGTFGPNPLDGTFGPEVRFTGIPADLKPNRPPSDGFQFFGQADIDAGSGTMTVALKDVAGKTLFSQALTPEG